MPISQNNNIRLSPKVSDLTNHGVLAQLKSTQAWIPFYGAGVKVNQKIIGYSLNTRVAVVPMCMP